LGFAVWAAQRGLSREISAEETAPRHQVRKDAFIRAPLLRKELLWLARDRGALVQIFVLPLMLIGYQFLNLHNLLSRAHAGWAVVAAVAVFAGTYFVLALAPRSLASEGQALWIALTWPMGLERLLR